MTKRPGQNIVHYARCQFRLAALKKALARFGSPDIICHDERIERNLPALTEIAILSPMVPFACRRVPLAKLNGAYL